MKQLALLVCCFLACHFPVLAESPDQWVTLGRRIHGGFGTYIALGIRVGLNARERLKAEPRDLDVTYQDGPNAPCPCVVDGIMLATVATPGQNSLRVLPAKSDPTTFGVVTIKNKKTGQSLRYVMPDARLLLDNWNRDQTGRERYDAVMNAPQDFLFRVETLSNASNPTLRRAK